MNGSADVRLPVGLWSNGRRHRMAVLRPMSGADQEFLTTFPASLSAAERTSHLLARCLTKVGPQQPGSLEAVRQLTTGDREFLLLHLRRITFGDRLETIVRCPRHGCDEPMEVPLTVTALVSAAPGDLDLSPVVERDGIRFRLPCGADLEAVADVARSAPSRAALWLFERCVEHADIQADTMEQVGRWMAELDPLAETRLSLACPACGHSFTSLLDAGTYLFEETTLRARHLYHEVHLLAYHYHWSEAEILGMTPAKRSRYITLLQDALRGEQRL
jgi:hypothetical protein